MSLFEPPPLPGDPGKTPTNFLETLGIGGNATVYKATCPTHGYIALKVLHPGKRTTEEDIKRFYREYVSLPELKHPNIVRVYNSGKHGSILGLQWNSLMAPTYRENLIDSWSRSSRSRIPKD